MTKKRKSVALTKDEFKVFKQYRKTFRTEQECAEAIGVERWIINRTIIVGSGAPESIEKIRAAIQPLL